MNILLIGAPGSGKGTQAEKLVEEKGLQHLSTGHLFRQNLKEKSPLGQQAQLYIDKGQLVPDAITNEMVEAFLQNALPGKGFVFDGYPRNISQAEALSKILQPKHWLLDKVFFLEIPEDQVVERLSGRRFAPQSGLVYHIKSRPPKKAGVCDKSGEALIARSDDKEEILRARLKVFYKTVQPLLEHYKNRNLLKVIPAGRPENEVFSHILSHLAQKLSRSRESKNPGKNKKN